MSFVQREHDRLEDAMALIPTSDPRWRQLHAARQALGWALEPTGFKAPSKSIMGSLSNSEDCLERIRPPESSDTSGHYERQ